MSKPPTLTRQLDRCDVCGTKIHRMDLVRTQVEYVSHEGNNYLEYSTYDSTGWTKVDSTDRSTIGVLWADDTHLRVNDDNTLTEANGIQTWEDTGTLYTTSLNLDVSTWDSFVFSVEVAPYQNTSITGYDPSLTVKMGTISENGDTKYLSRTWSINGHQRVWYADTSPVALTVAASANWYIEVTAASGMYWMADKFQLEKNATKPGDFISTVGSAVSVSADTAAVAVRKVCPNCYETVLKKSTRYGRRRREVEAVIPTDIQEF